MYARIALIACLSLAAAPVQAQDFLGGLARRAAASAAGQAIGRAVAHQATPEAAPAATASAPQPSSEPPSRRRNSRADDAPEAEGLQGLEEPEREKACMARIPVDQPRGRSAENSAAFLRCMGPRYGDGG